MGGLAPSVIAADYGRFAEQLSAVEPESTRWHVDVMDGHYVPNLTIGPDFCRTIARFSRLPQDVHLMITNPTETWEWYAEAGASRIAFHPETADDPAVLLRAIREAGPGAGLAVNPDVEPEAIEPYLPEVDHLVVMSVYPGFSGQSFIPDAVPKLRRLRELADRRERHVELLIDGGVNAETAPGCVEAGADVLISASAVFGSDDPRAAAVQLREISERRTGAASG